MLDINNIDSIVSILKRNGIIDPVVQYRQEFYIPYSENIPRSIATIPFKDPGLSITLYKDKNLEFFHEWDVKWGMGTFFWEDVLPEQGRHQAGWLAQLEGCLNLDFIKEIEDKTYYRYHEHHHRADEDPKLANHEFLIFHLRPESNKSEGGYIYLKEDLKKHNILEISNNLDDIFNLGWPDGDYEFRKNWGVGNRKIDGSSIYGLEHYPLHGSSYLFHGGDNLSSGEAQDFSKRIYRPTVEDGIKIKHWRLKFVRSPEKRNSELIRDLIIPYLQRIGSEYNLEIFKCEGGKMDLEFSPDFKFIKIIMAINPSSHRWTHGGSEWIKVDSTFMLEIVDSMDKNLDFILDLKIS